MLWDEMRLYNGVGESFMDFTLEVSQFSRNETVATHIYERLEADSITAQISRLLGAPQRMKNFFILAKYFISFSIIGL